MGRPLAGQILKHFEPDELRHITRAASGLGSVPPEAIEGLVDDFTSAFLRGVDLHGSAGEARDLLAAILPPEDVAAIMSDVSGMAAGAVWERIGQISEPTIAAYLAREHGQVAALVLSRITPAQAARVLSQLPRPRALEATRRMLSLKPMTDEAVRLIERILHDDLLTGAARRSGPDSTARVADIINQLDRSQMDEMLANLAETQPKTVEKLRSLLFTFDDVAQLDKKARMALFDAVPTDQVVLALSGTEEHFRDLILSSLAARARRMVEHELASDAAPAQRDIVKARRAIADRALAMIERGDIDAGRSEQSDHFA